MSGHDTAKPDELHFDGFDLAEWSALWRPSFAICNLFRDRGLIISERSIDGAPRFCVRCPGHEYGVLEEAHCLDGDRSKIDCTLQCAHATCASLTFPQLVRRYLEAGLISLDDLQNPKYRGGPLLPLGFLCDVDYTHGDIFGAWQTYKKGPRANVGGLAQVAKKRDLHRSFQSMLKAQKGVIEGALPVCSYVRVEARIADENGENRGLRLAFYDADGRLHYHDVSEALLNTEGTGLFAELGAAGLSVSTDAIGRTAFRRLLKSWRTERRATLYSRPGWHAKNSLFITPSGFAIERMSDQWSGHERTLSPSVRVRNPIRHDGANDTEAEGWWRGVVGEIWKGDTDQFAFGMLAGCSGVLASLIGESFGFHFAGRTSIGKTTTQIIAAGCVADPKPKQGVLVTADLRPHELDQALRGATGTCLHIDDNKTGNINVQTLGYLATSGLWQTPFTISTEDSLAKAVGRDMKDGLTVRLCSIDFESVPRIDGSRADGIRRAALDHYGCLLPHFVEKVIDLGYNSATDELCARIDAYADHYSADTPLARRSEWRRAARAFAVLRAVGDVYLEMNLLPEGVCATDVERVVRWGWTTYVKGRSTSDPITSSIEALSDWLEDNLGGSVQPLTSSKPARDVAAWLGPDGVAYVRSEHINCVRGSSLGRGALVAALRERGLLVTGRGSEKNLVWTNVPGHGRIRHYRVKLGSTTGNGLSGDSRPGLGRRTQPPGMGPLV